MARVMIDPKKLNELKQVIEESFAVVVNEFSQECTAVIEDPDEFSDLGYVDHDIVLTGRLRDSQEIGVTRSNQEVIASFSWNPIDPETGRYYAGDVFTGYGRMPGRNWPDRAARRQDWLKIFEGEIQQRWQ